MYVQLTCAIVDADANNRQELAGFLARFGIPVVAQLPSVDGLAGLLSRSEGPTLVIVNLDPATQQTLRAISHLPRQHTHVSFFLMSQLLDANLLMEAMHLGIKEFIPLPMSEEKFTAALERVAQTQSGGKRAKVIHASGELAASRALAEAAQIISANPTTLQLRYLQTLAEIATEKNSTIVFPIPIDFLSGILKR